MTIPNSNPGVRPVEYKVLVRPDPVAKKTESGIYLPDESHEKQEWAQVKGTLAAVGGSAFQDFTVDERAALKPGARVYYDKYQGVKVFGADGDEYVLMQDKNIAALITNEAAAPATSLKGRKAGGLSAA